MERTTGATLTPGFVAALTEQMAAVAQELSAWVGSAPRTLGELEQRTLAATKELGNAMLAGACALLAAPPPAPERPCACGQPATYLRHRSAQVTTILGPIAIARAYYYCAQCRHGHAPLDQQLG